MAALVAAPGCGGGEGATRFSASVVVPGAPKAPDFELRDAADAARVRLSDFRGRPVLLTFLYVNCPDVCPLTVSYLREALTELGGRAADAHVVAVSVDPRGDRPAAVRRFLRAHRMERWMTYLVGSRRELARVWRSYGIAVKAAPEDREVGHSALVYGIDASGAKRLAFGQDFKPAQVVHDVPLLAKDA